MGEPEFFICLTCETPSYSFDWNDGKILAIVCATCGNDEPSEFVTEAEFEGEDEE